MDSEKVIKRDNEYVLHTYNRNPIALEKGPRPVCRRPRGPEVSGFHQRHRREQPGLLRPDLGRGRLRAGPQAAAHLQPLLYCPLRQAGQKAVQAHRHEQGVFRKFRCRGQRGCHQGRPQVQRGPLPQGPHHGHHAGEQLPRPHHRHPDRHRSGGVPQLLWPLQRGLCLYNRR